MHQRTETARSSTHSDTARTHSFSPVGSGDFAARLRFYAPLADCCRGDASQPVPSSGQSTA